MRLPDVEFAVADEPVPEGSTQLMPLGGKKGGRPIIVPVSDPQLRAWRKEIRRCASMAMRDRPLLVGPVAMSLQFVVAAPMKMPTGRTAPTVPPDLDKLVRAVGDALSATGRAERRQPAVCFENDSQITEFWPPFLKRYPQVGEVPGVIVRLWALGPQQARLGLDRASDT